MRIDCRIGSLAAGENHPLLVIAGPCVLESGDVNLLVASTLRDCCEALGLGFVFKASFDKANRTSVDAPRGPGLEAGLDALRAVAEDAGVVVTTDVHDPRQANPAASVADLLQVPAFLCRQTDLLRACAETGRPVNVKKGQFMSPAEMRHVTAKLESFGCRDFMLTERGTFFGYHRLVNDFIGLGDLMDLGRPVCFDVTHSTQLPGGGERRTAGRPDRAALLTRAAVAAGVDAIFLECHPCPEQAASDPDTMQSLDAVPGILEAAASLHRALRPAVP